MTQFTVLNATGLPDPLLAERMLAGRQDGVNNTMVMLMVIWIQGETP